MKGVLSDTKVRFFAHSFQGQKPFFQYRQRVPQPNKKAAEVLNFGGFFNAITSSFWVPS